MSEARIDYDPRPSHSPRLYGSADDVSGARSRRDAVVPKPSPAKLRRLRQMAIIKACREAEPPVPFSTLEVTLDISRMHAARLYKLACRKSLRRN